MSAALSREAAEERLAAVRARVGAAAARAGRDSSEVALVGVAKGQPAERVAALVRAGLRDVAENFAQEARAKIPRVAALLEPSGAPPPRWHFVGQLQRNKARVVVPLVACVHSVDRESLARELDRRARAAGRRLEVLLQVNLSAEAQKGGAAPESLCELLRALRPLQALRAVGLMTVPAAAEDREAARSPFARLRELRDTLARVPEGAGLRELSMGMSADLEVAVEEGATLVRVGTDLFGPREESQA